MNQYFKFTMKRLSFLLMVLLFCLIFSQNTVISAERTGLLKEISQSAKKSHNVVKIILFHAPNCKHCIDLKRNYLPKIIAKYTDKIEIVYLDTTETENFKVLLATAEKFSIEKGKVPSILVGDYFLVGDTEIESGLEFILDKYIDSQKIPILKIDKIDLLGKFKSFSPLAVVAAGLIDGINPCAFTVLIFFISFLTLMGYKKKDLSIIGLVFILAVFLTYLAIGLGLFKGLYELRQFYTLMQGAYIGLAVLCFMMAYLNLRDFFVYKKTKDTSSLKVKLPKPVRSRINAIISKYYRKEPGSKSSHSSIIGLILSTFIVGFLVSLLEAVCTGQVYLPTIVFILKEQTLRIRAISFLLLYNLMFIAPLLLILLLVVFGMGSKKLEEFFRRRIAVVKILMFVLFLGLGLFLLKGILL